MDTALMLRAPSDILSKAQDNSRLEVTSLSNWHLSLVFRFN